MSMTLAAVLAAAALFGGPLLAWGMGVWGERTELANEQARSRNPSSGSSIAGHMHPQSVSGWTGVEPPPAVGAAPPVPPTLVDTVDAPLTVSTSLHSPFPTELGGRGTGFPPGPSASTGPTASVGGAPASSSPPTEHYPGDQP